VWKNQDADGYGAKQYIMSTVASTKGSIHPYISWIDASDTERANDEDKEEKI